MQRQPIVDQVEVLAEVAKVILYFENEGLTPYESKIVMIEAVKTMDNVDSHIVMNSKLKEKYNMELFKPDDEAEGK